MDALLGQAVQFVVQAVGLPAVLRTAAKRRPPCHIRSGAQGLTRESGHSRSADSLRAQSPGDQAAAPTGQGPPRGAVTLAGESWQKGQVKTPAKTWAQSMGALLGKEVSHWLRAGTEAGWSVRAELAASSKIRARLTGRQRSRQAAGYVFSSRFNEAWASGASEAPARPWPGPGDELQ